MESMVSETSKDSKAILGELQRANEVMAEVPATRESHHRETMEAMKAQTINLEHIKENVIGKETAEELKKVSEAHNQMLMNQQEMLKKLP